MTKEHREYCKEVMGLNQRECPKCGKVPKVWRLKDRHWYCQRCADLDKSD